MRRNALASLLLLLLLAPAARADFEDGYFPLARGNVWVYRDAGGTEREVRCDSAQTFGGAKQFRLRDYNGATHWVRETAAGRVYVGTTRTWYRFDAAVGATWTFSATGSAIPGSNGARLEVVSRSESLTVPAGSFSTIHLRWRASGVADAGITDEWFARGVGLVKRTQQSIAGPRSETLVRATISGALVPSSGSIVSVLDGSTGAFGIAGVVPASRVSLRVLLDEGLDRPTGAAFHPDGSLWVVNRGDDSVTIVDRLGQPAQRWRSFADDSDHFNNDPMAIAFSRRRLEMATIGESRNDYNGKAAPNDFMGPVLWPADRSIFTGGAATHLDMLHHSPQSVGIAAGETSTGTDRREYWVFNGQSGCIDRYFFNAPHVLGGHDHADGLTFRYGSGLRRVAGVPGHLALDEASGALFIADTGNGRIARLDTRAYDVAASTAIAGLHPETTLRRVTGAQLVRVTPQGALTRPAGLLLAGERLVVSDNGTGKVVVFGKDGAKVGEADTGLGAGALGGLVATADGRLLVLDMRGGRVLELSITP
jgi:hypothetical protein